jgi:hypothetical protein
MLLMVSRVGSRLAANYWTIRDLVVRFLASLADICSSLSDAGAILTAMALLVTELADDFAGVLVALEPYMSFTLAAGALKLLRALIG